MLDKMIFHECPFCDTALIYSVSTSCSDVTHYFYVRKNDSNDEALKIEFSLSNNNIRVFFDLEDKRCYLYLWKDENMHWFETPLDYFEPDLSNIPLLREKLITLLPYL